MAAVTPSVGNWGVRFCLCRKIQFSLLIQFPLKLHSFKNRICDSLIFSSERTQKLKHPRSLCFNILRTLASGLWDCHFVASFLYAARTDKYAMRLL